MKIDFPLLPYPTDLSNFEKLTNLGAQLRQFHLLEWNVVEKYITQYPKDGNNVVEKIRFDMPDYIHSVPNKNGEIIIQKIKERSISMKHNILLKVPLVSWNFYIGGYQPAQKWLKDRKGRTLEFDDILHYQTIIVALYETARLMKEIDVVGNG